MTIRQFKELINKYGFYATIEQIREYQREIRKNRNNK